MTKTALLMGGIPYGSQMELGWWLAPESFKTAGGECPMSYDHWVNDAYVYEHLASWFVTPAGVTVMHNLDLSQPQERQAYELALAGRLKLSYGRGASPEETRARVATKRGRQLPVIHKPLVLPVEHWSYTVDPAFPQSPVKIII